jgi:hypothetical protein
MFKFKKILPPLNSRTIAYGAAALLVVLLLGRFFLAGGTGAGSDIIVRPVKGEFRVTVASTGELQAKNSIEIRGPENARAADIYNMKISNLIPEGTVVKKGAFVAELDKAEILNKIRESQLNVQKLEAEYQQTMLDSTLTLAQARDELVNLKYTEEEKRIIVEQSAYEAPAMQRQAQIDLERAQRNTEQATTNYETKKKQSIAKMEVAGADLTKERQRLDRYQKTMEEFTIKAPADGMVVYAREWGGKKKVVGSTISPWDPTVATLPDLRVMESITYITEIDIQKIAVDQAVKINLDADPNKTLSGTVTSVANIGEQRPNSDAKVFEVKIRVNESDTTLRPSMTTSNEILVARLDSVLSLPLECIQTVDSTTFVYRKDGGDAVRQQVRLGLINENEAVILEGVGEDDQVFLVPPDERDPKTILLTRKD